LKKAALKFIWIQLELQVVGINDPNIEMQFIFKIMIVFMVGFDKVVTFEGDIINH